MQRATIRVGLQKLNRKRKRKYTDKKPNPAERLEMSRIRSAQTICIVGVYTHTYMPRRLWIIYHCPVTTLFAENSIILPSEDYPLNAIYPLIESLQPRNPHRRRQNPSPLLDLKRLRHQPRCLAGKRLEMRALCMGLQGCCIAVSIVIIVSLVYPSITHNNIHIKGKSIRGKGGRLPLHNINLILLLCTGKGKVEQRVRFVGLHLLGEFGQRGGELLICQYAYSSTESM